MDYGSFIQGILSFYGQEQAQKLTQQQIDTYKEQLANLQGIPLPSLPNITPEQLGAAASSQVYSDPALRQNQQDSLSEYNNIDQQGGLDFKTRADINNLLNQTESSAQSGAASIRQHLQGTGQLGSGADIAMQQGNAQANASRANTDAWQQASEAQTNRMQALAGKTSLATNMRGEDLAEKQSRAAAQDARDTWNAQSRDKADYYNSGLPQQQFNNQVSKVTGSFAPGSNLASAYGNASNNAANFWSGLGYAANKGTQTLGGSGSGGGGGGGGGVNPDDPNSVYGQGTNYGGSDPSDWENPYGGY